MSGPLTEMSLSEHKENDYKPEISLAPSGQSENYIEKQQTYREPNGTYSSSVCTHLSSSMTWLPINQTKLLKYGTAVLSRM